MKFKKRCVFMVPDRTIIVIPARYGSTRFPGKPLVKIHNVPMIVRVWAQAKKSSLANEVIVATDHDEIRAVIEASGGICVMTSPDLPSGTDRIAAAVKNYQAEFVVNLQGDEPLIDPDSIDLAIRTLWADEKADMATLATPLIDESDFFNPNIVKVVMNQFHNALYFSRSPIPYPAASLPDQGIRGYRHIGIYVFRKKWLDRFVTSPPALLEHVEKLEQLRALYLGGIIRIAIVKQVFPGVDNPEDIAIIESLMNEQKVR